MRRFLLLALVWLATIVACSAQPPATAVAAPPGAAPAPPLADPVATGFPAYRARAGRSRPVVAVVAENYYTELSDYVVPYGIVAASGAADVFALATQPGPVRLFPALKIEPQATTAQFDTRFPDGADYVIVPALHKTDDPTLVGWVAAQSRKGATVIGVCDGVWVVANAGLLNGRKATGHWFSFDDLKKKFPQTEWLRERRYVADGNVVTTTGVSAAIPVSLALVQAIAGREHAQALADSLGAVDRGVAHPSERFRITAQHAGTVAKNFVAFWAHEDLGVQVEPGVDELALALTAEPYSWTHRSQVHAIAQKAGPIPTKRGLTLLPDRVAGASSPPDRMLTLDAARPLRALDDALRRIEADYGRATAAYVALHMEYPGY